MRGVIDLADRKFEQRLEAWHRELKNQIIVPVSEICFEGARTFERLSVRQAEALCYTPMPVGTAWGERREYGWFRAKVSVDKELAGQRLVLISGLGGEQLVYVNGRARGSVDKKHGYVTLFRAAPETADLQLLIECYAGHGETKENLGPCPPERMPLKAVDGPQQVVGQSFLALFDETAYQLYMDVDTLMQLRSCLEESSLRSQKVNEALCDFTHTVDFELAPEARRASYARAREKLRAVLACKNGSTAPALHIIGQSHIDLGWLWPMENTWHKAVRTYANQLGLMEEYPEYRFLACEPALLEMLFEADPEVYGRVKENVKRGRFIPDGAFYVECDTNIPSGESLVRQLMWGKRWFRDNLGADSRVAWQPDTFGFTACLPQLLKAFHVDYFATQKLLRAENEGGRFPYQDFLWEGADGTRVQALSFYKNNAQTSPVHLYERWTKHRSQLRNIDALLYPFGYGDGGGGADRDMLEYLRREEDLEGLPRTRWTTLEEHFRLNAVNAAKNLWKGELYLSWHRGTCTAQRKTKLALRQLEQALHDVEFLLAQADGDRRAQAMPIVRSAWKTLLIHQFHDIAAGVGIRDVHEEAVEALSIARREIDALISDLFRNVYAVQAAPNCATLLNTLPFRRTEWVALPDGSAGLVDLPASGTRTVSAGDLRLPRQRVRVVETGKELAIDNGAIAFTLHRDGAISDLRDKRSGHTLQDAGMRMNDLRLYKNVESVYDAWELSPGYEEDLVDDGETLSFAAEGADTPLFTAVVVRRIGNSHIRQRISVRAGDHRIEFHTEVDWQERHKLLKVHFESNIRSLNAIHEMQFCHVERPAHRNDLQAADRFEVCNHHYSALFEATGGIAVLNRAIYGVSCLDGDIALSLLRAPCVPDETCDRGGQCFDYALALYDAPLALSPITRDGYAYNCPVLQLPGKGAEREGIRAENALIETIKPAEDGKGIILRVWEHRGGRTRARLVLDRACRVFACGMDEDDIEPLAEASEVEFALHAFEIKTFLLLYA